MADKAKSCIVAGWFGGSATVAERILLIGASRRAAVLGRSWELVVAASGKRAKALVDERGFDLIIVDALAMRLPGGRICRDIRRYYPDCPLIHICTKSAAKTSDAADVILSPPFSKRRLMAVVARVLQQEGMDVLECGPFTINRTIGVLQAHGKETRLSPKVADLIALFMTHPNQVLRREAIMRQVWKTSYLGDTRTLDVHIYYARDALEEDRRSPVYIKTLRGVGYRLEIDTA